MPPPRTPNTAKVAYRAVLALLAAAWSTWPPPPMPVRARYMPGQQKQTRPMRQTWASGEL
ncbi:putative UNC93-like protein 1 [Iris pallida]|uniref:UNC93-like protein 1 n=1 Tax=Iris pallida TaxID=29817 RepID=A0AAX6DHN0_IRIPA|nr:putative UNC93-like protein 1 [Iris pallida]